MWKVLPANPERAFTYKAGVGETFLVFLSLCLSFAEYRKNAALKPLHLPNIPKQWLKYLHFFPVWLFEWNCNISKAHKNYTGMSWIMKNLNGDKPPKMSDSRCTQDSIWPFSSFHHLWWIWSWFTPVRQDKDLIIAPICHVLVPIQTNANVSAEHESCLQRFFCSWEQNSKSWKYSKSLQRGWFN